MIDDYWMAYKDTLRPYRHYRLWERLYETGHLSPTAFYAYRARLFWAEQPPLRVPVQEEHEALPNEQTGKIAVPTRTLPTLRMGAVTIPMQTEKYGGA